MLGRPLHEIAIAENLKRLCSRYDSVSDVSRRLGINRQQLNKYLAGVSHPSLRNLRRITDFFGVDEFEILLPPEEFAAKVLPRRPKIAAPTAFVPALLPPSRADSQALLAPYCGFYHVYFHTPVWSNHIVRALVHVYQTDGRTATRTVERLREATTRGQTQGQTGPVQKFRGTLTHVVDRLCILEYETLIGELASMTVLYPSHRNALRLLTGVMVGVASGGSRQPFASRIVYEFIGRTIDARVALMKCALFSPNDDSVPEAIRSRIRNTIEPGESVLVPRAY
jgi:transcriptional regulator with XRE-family HTH domain